MFIWNGIQMAPLHRSHSLAIVQVLILYHLVTARAAVALGGESTRVDRDGAALIEQL